MARLPVERTGGKLAITIRVPMDSSYLFEPDTTTYPFVRGLPAQPKGTAPEVPLEPFDHMLVLKQPEFEYQRTGPAEGLKHPSWITCDGLTSIEKSRLTDYVGALSPARVRELNRALRSALELE